MKRLIRPTILAAMLVAVVLLSCGTAMANVVGITEHGILNPVAWGIASLKTTRVYATTNIAGAWAIIDVRDYKGVVRTLYSGPAAASGVRLWTRPWDGTDANGHRLPTGNYQYRVRISKGTIKLVATGSLPVSRLRFTVTTDRDKNFSRYLYPGLTRVYALCDYTGDARLDARVLRPNSTTRDWTMPAQDLTAPGPGKSKWSSPSTAAYRFNASGATGAYRTISMFATSDYHDPSAPPWPPITGAFSLTFMQ
jgi:hypothetical protein